MVGHVSRPADVVSYPCVGVRALWSP